MIIERASDILKRLCRSALKSGREPDSVKLIAVTKTIDIDRIKEAIDAGLRIFGENRVQEAQKKISNLKFEISDSKIEWHLIGPLQRNKAKYAVRLFNLIQTVDSIELAAEIDKETEKIGRIQDVLIQVKLSEEEAKHGISEEKLISLLQAVEGMKNLNLKGLMTMPPYFENPNDVRPYFRRLREIRDHAEESGFKLPELSMGMSHDFETAVEEGATMVRIGFALFGERIIKP
ncbi:MAG: YggS family pyridoxal phosphate-dependent enzyme [Nitrospirae bacterium]|nr:YggS family pyridoxal phosphate-dependent enzyme [Nitrospirota bacterium]